MSKEAYALFLRAKKVKSLQEIADAIGIHVGTVKRWKLLKDVPNHYCGDLSRMLGETYMGGDERDKDQFFTKPAVAGECRDAFLETLEEYGIDEEEYYWLEPSVGAGAFYDLMPKGRRTGMDLDPQCSGIRQQDFLLWEPPSTRKYLELGNPPFGLRGHLALQFMNKNYEQVDAIGFILPPLFNSDGKGAPGKRVKGYVLAKTIDLPANSFVYPDGREVDVESVFQIWIKPDAVKKGKLPERNIKTCDQYIRVYSLSDGGTSASTRNKDMLHKCDVYLPSTCFDGMKAYKTFEELPQRRGYGIVIHKQKRKLRKLLMDTDWKNVAFRSTNGALNLRTSNIVEVVIEHGVHDD